jgi:hypothetical protein
VGVFAARRGKVTYLNKTSRLFLQTSHQLRKGEAAFVVALSRKATKIADRLKVNAPHGGDQLQGLPHNGADGISVHPSHKGRDEDDTKTYLSAALDGLEFLVQERSSPQRAIYRIIDTVELKKNR